MTDLDADITRRPLHPSKPVISYSTEFFPNVERYHRSDDYSRNSGYATTSNYKAVLLNLVAVGRAFKTYTDMDDLTSPPAGYDSVRPFPYTLSSYYP